MSLMRFIKIGLAWMVSLFLALPVLVVGLLVYSFSTCVRALASRLEPEFVNWKQLIEFDPELGWRPIAHLDAHYMVKRDGIHRIQTDSMGWPRKDALNDEHDIVVIGDSYAFGFGIDTGSSFADLTEQPKIKAIGAPGYSMVQGVILMRQLAHQLSGKLVVWFVYPENDLYDNLFPSVFGYRSPFARNKNGSDSWEIVSDHISPDTWVSSARIRPNIDVLAELCTKSPLSDRVYSACGYLIGEAVKACTSAGARLAIFAIPNLNQLESQGRKMLSSKVPNADQFDATYPDQRISGICDLYGVPFIAGSANLRSEDYKTWERWHWTAGGHAKVAELLRQLHDSHSSNTLSLNPSKSPIDLKSVDTEVASTY